MESVCQLLDRKRGERIRGSEGGERERGRVTYNYKKRPPHGTSPDDSNRRHDHRDDPSDEQQGSKRHGLAARDDIIVSPNHDTPHSNAKGNGSKNLTDNELNIKGAISKVLKLLKCGQYYSWQIENLTLLSKCKHILWRTPLMCLQDTCVYSFDDCRIPYFLE